MMATEVRQHGVKGIYHGGEWLPIEECAQHVSQLNGAEECNKNCSTCPRSRSRRSAAKRDGSYDVVVIGAGCIGSAIARELSKTTCSVLLLESADDVTQGATKGNSGIVHAGFDDKPGTTRAKFCWPGNQMFPKLDEELHFGYQKNGSLVLARGSEEEKVLEELMERGRKNGVKRLKILKRDEVLAVEPHVAPDVTAALLSPDAGNLIPYEYAIALAENAVDNGVELRIRREVTAIEAQDSEEGFTLKVRHWEPANYVKSVLHKQHSGGKNASGKKGSGSGTSVLFTAATIGLASGLSLGKAVAPPLKAYLPHTPAEYRFIVEYLVENPGVLYVICMLLCATLAFQLNIGAAKSAADSGGGKEDDAVSSSMEIPPVGDGGRAITVDEMKIGGSGSSSVMHGETVETETVLTRYVVNAAGCYSDKVAAMIGDESFKIKPRIGDYILLNRNQGHFAKHTLFPCPHPVLGKGVLVQTTLWGNLILGPTARDMHLPEVANQTPSEIMHYILSKCRQLVPAFDPAEVIHSFSGARAKNSTGDWIIRPSEIHPKFIHAAGIDSPGLAGSPAIAVEIVRLLGVAGLELKPNAEFNPYRAPIIVPKDGWKGIRAGPVGKVTDPKQNVVCKCEKVTEAEVVTALHRALPIDSTQAIRKRTRAGMGHCQAAADNYNCECRVAEIIARETGLPAEAVGRRPWPATSSLERRWLSDEEKQSIAKLAEA